MSQNCRIGKVYVHPDYEQNEDLSWLQEYRQGIVDLLNEAAEGDEDIEFEIGLN